MSVQQWIETFLPVKSSQSGIVFSGRCGNGVARVRMRLRWWFEMKLFVGGV